jgi:hypothetical protein
MKKTVGQQLLAAFISQQLGISRERAMKLYVRKHKIHPSWEALGVQLLGDSQSFARGSAAQKVSRKAEGSRAQKGEKLDAKKR